MASIALLTLEDRTGYVIDDALAIDELRSRGHDVDEVPWSRTDADWTRYALVVVRTPWDYTERPGAFLEVLARIEALGVALENPRAVIAWNLHKRYLRELEQRGVRVVQTTWGQGGDALLALRERTRHPFVVKPVIGANARDTFVIDASTDEARMQHIAALYASREWMAQPFVRSVIEEGEHSLFYFSGVLSHAILKTPAAGDFRVQEEHGGIIRAIEPPADVRAAAERALERLPGPLLQARIDLVRLEDGTPALMEAELIEPSLYFRMHPDAPRRFADAVERRMRR
jgi:glutathione synthase/RimK-type ligase-like ATP-grasp enzyme